MAVNIKITGLQQLSDSLKKKLITIADKDKVLRTVATTMCGNLVVRIHENGENALEGNIGRYSTKPIYVSPKSSPRSFGANTGKGGKSTFKNGNKHKSRYFAGGYKDFRNKIGRRIDVVNLSLSGQMQNDFSVGIKNPIKTSAGWGLGFKNPLNAEKAEGLEKKYAPIWRLSGNEHRQAQHVADFETNKILKSK